MANLRSNAKAVETENMNRTPDLKINTTYEANTWLCHYKYKYILSIVEIGYDRRDQPLLSSLRALTMIPIIDKDKDLVLNAQSREIKVA